MIGVTVTSLGFSSEIVLSNTGPDESFGFLGLSLELSSLILTTEGDGTTRSSSTKERNFNWLSYGESDSWKKKKVHSEKERVHKHHITSKCKP